MAGRLTDIALRVAGLSENRARPAALASIRPPVGATADPMFNSIPHQPMWSQYDGPNSVTLSRRNIYAARCIETIAKSVSGLPFNAGNAVSRAARPTTAMQQLLGPAPGGPNPSWSAAKLWRFTVTQYMTLGKFAWLKEYDGAGRVIALWPLMAQYVIPVIADPKAGIGYFEKYRYGTQGSLGYREFSLKDLVYVWRPSQRDVRQPESPLALARFGIDIMALLDQFDNSFLTNGGVPSHLIITPPFSSRAEQRSFRDQFSRKFGGAANSNKAMFAEEVTAPGEDGSVVGARSSVDVKVIGTTQKDAKLDVLRDAKIMDMCVTFGVPLSMLGYSADSKYTNMEVDRDNYWQETIKPLLTELEDGTNLTLGLDLDGPKDVGWFDTADVPELRPAPLLSEAGGMAAVAAGLITPNQYLIDRGLPASTEPDMDRLRTPAPAAKPGGDGPPKQGEEVPELPGGPVPEPPIATARTHVQAVRVDRLAPVREQLALELADQAKELDLRAAGKRGGRNKARASVSLALVYDADHWSQRMARNLAPALRAAGYAGEQITRWSEDVTAHLQDHLAAGGSDVAGEIDWAMGGLNEPNQPHHSVEAGFLEASLLGIHAGELAAADILGAIGAA